MNHLPTSNRSFFNEHRSGLSYMDFLPDDIKEVFSSDTKYDRFDCVISCANKWLRLNAQWEINTCEGIESKDNNPVINPSKMCYPEKANYRSNLDRGLRLWLKRCPAGEERVQQIGYINLVPDETVPGGKFAHTKYETLDDVLLKFNNASSTSPLPGRIITIDSQEVEIKSGGIIDPERSRHIFVIRIFYEVGDPLYEEIGMTDFVPEVIGSSCFGANPEYETFAALFEKASHWSSSQSDLKICNMQSLGIKVQKEIVNTRKMSYTGHDGHQITYVRILRVTHVRKLPFDHAPPIHFSYKSFVSAQLKPGTLLTCFQPTIETLQETMQRVSSWIKATGAEVVNMETSAVRLQGNTALHSSEKSYFYKPGSEEYPKFVVVIRAYLKGSYAEPFEDDATPARGMTTKHTVFIFLILLIFCTFMGLVLTTIIVYTVH